MAQGDSTSTILAVDSAAIVTWVEATRVTANDKWFIAPVANGQQVIIIHTEEA